MFDCTRKQPIAVRVRHVAPITRTRGHAYPPPCTSRTVKVIVSISYLYEAIALPRDDAPHIVQWGRPMHGRSKVVGPTKIYLNRW